MKKLLTILFACTIVEAISTLRPGAQWNLRGSTLAGLEWLDASKPPTQADIDQTIADCQAQDSLKKSQKDQAVIDAKNPAKTADQRLDALIKAIDLK